MTWSAAAAGHRRSACWCRCCFRSCRCCTCASSSRRCCCATKRRRAGATGSAAPCHRRGVGRRSSALTAWQAASLQDRPGRLRRLRGAGVRAASGGPRAGRRLIAPLANSRSFPLRHAVLHLSRPGNQTRVILLAVGLGAFFIVGVRSLQASLLERVLDSDRRPTRPTCSCSTSSASRPTACARSCATRRNGAGRVQLIPVLRARVVGVSGRETNLDSVDDVRGSGMALGREYTITYRDHLEANERILDGRVLERAVGRARGVGRARDRTSAPGLDVGDTMRFDILGRVISARVTSIRDVEWRDSRNGGFMFVFRPGALDQAPQTFVVAAQGAGGRRGARPVPARSGRAVPERVGDRLPRDPRRRCATSCRR